MYKGESGTIQLATGDASKLGLKLCLCVSFLRAETALQTEATAARSLSGPAPPTTPIHSPATAARDVEATLSYKWATAR